jgi:hypothetical protein
VEVPSKAHLPYIAAKAWNHTLENNAFYPKSDITRLHLFQRDGLEAGQGHSIYVPRN